ncbi:Salicylate carboxymethyltransferase [Cucurbita argyrosperma subsp. argyrosperma]|nr:Salicylate carboxymethyltransferase [Cucurbita argyrosperma subsp. argyrosperma]
MVKHITMEAIEQVYLSTGAPASFGIADLGCSSGPNSLSIVKEIIQAVQSLSSSHLQPPPEFRVYLNDLPTNDFNSIFKALPDFCRELQNEGKNQNPSGFFIGAYPGSFYQRLFPNNCLHFVYSSYSLHWLSRVCRHCYFLFPHFLFLFLDFL